MMASNNVLIALCVIVGVALINQVNSKKICRKDDECSHLGEFTCIKTFCEWGVCGCPRNKAAKYVGQSDKFKCVPFKKVGESCSNAHDDGICGAEGSNCNETTHECTCDTGKVPISGGEKCASQGDTNDGETSGSTGSTEPCDKKKYLGFNYDKTFPQPKCLDILHGDSCINSVDCTGNSMICNKDTSKCECAKVTLVNVIVPNVPDYDKKSCSKGLSHGASCNGSLDGHCDGSKGLVCGDICDLTGKNGKSDRTSTCICGPYHTGSGSCTPIAKDGSCHGDENCKGWSKKGICVASKCVEGAGVRAAAAFITLLLPIFVIIM